ncbi:type I inositol polyphosphate 5-phosphatase 4 isoform X1 [Neltuma alba]|uniref:type I inositol polyphosphate 5-phosphatase 4 isoform X1 n=2 Tax=Neltuma alba TaxID=207710 RepID=UPI0010A3DE2A|nr:type I inositol polyphosphate 5-phosphatase 4-like isoform X1 [Prosopis alba]
MKLKEFDKPSYSLNGIEGFPYGAEDGSDDYSGGDLSFQSMELDPCIATNELKISVGTWNVAGRTPIGSLEVDLDEWLNLKNAADIYVLGFQEIVPLKTKTVIGVEDPKVARRWNQLIGRTLNSRGAYPWFTTPMQNSIPGGHNGYLGNPHSEDRKVYNKHGGNSMTEGWQIQEGEKYTLLASKKMVGIFISVWIRQELPRKYHVSNVKVCPVACGIMGCLGNKGSVAVSMLIEGTSFCFVTAHLAAGEKMNDKGRRNHQVAEIFKRTCFPRTPEDRYSHPLTILGHDRIFWFGDLNYRLSLEGSSARRLIVGQDWKALQQFDQLRKEREGGAFEGWKEGDIEFAPTYKYPASNCIKYSGGHPSRSGKKQRTPAWCDRILWYGKGVKQLQYFRSESKFSDHRPVSALFSTQIEIKSSSTGLIALHNMPKALLATDHGKSKRNEESKSTLLSLLTKDKEGS